MAKKNKRNEIDPDGDKILLGSVSNQMSGQRIKRISNKKTGFSEGQIKLIFGTVIVFLLVILIGSFVMVYNASSSASSAKKSAVAAENPSFKIRHESIGSQVILSYFKNEPSPIPLSNTVAWKGDTKNINADETDPSKLQSIKPKDSESLPSISGIELLGGDRVKFSMNDKVKLTNPDKFVGADQENLTYYVVINGQPLTVNIALLSPSDPKNTALPILLDTPSINTMKPSDAQENVGTDPGTSNGLLKFDVAGNKSLSSVVTRWAKAWVENDQGSLQQITQDPKAQKYVGLGGWSISSAPQIKWGYKTQNSKDSDVIIEISFDMTQTATTSDSNGKTKTKEFTSTQVMDLLIQKADTSLPAIVSWGPAGTWRDLTPYSVASNGNNKEQKQNLENPAATTEKNSSSDSSNSDSSSGSTGSISSSSIVPSTSKTNNSPKTEKMSPAECKENGLQC